MGQQINLVHTIHTDQAINEKILGLKPVKSSEKVFQSELDPENLLRQFYNSGYLEARIDSQWNEDGQQQLMISTGRQFLWYSLVQSFENPLGANLMNDPIKKKGSVFSLKELHVLQESYLETFTNAGYPFTRVKLDSVIIKDSLIEAKLIVEPGKRVRFDSLISRSDEIVNYRILQRISGIQKGDWYSASKLLKAQNYLVSSGLMSETELVEVGFFDDNAWLYIRPKKLKSNQISGIVGLAPFSTTGIPRLSGEFKIGLQNVARQMEEFRLNWRAPGNGTQKLQTDLKIPYLLGSSFGFTAQLDLYKKDSSYLNFGSQIGGRVNFVPGTWMELLYEKRQSSRLSQFSTFEVAEFDMNLTKLRWQVDTRNNPVYPRTGWMINQETGLGIKRSFGALEESEVGNYFEVNLSSELYIPVYKSWSVFFATDLGYRPGELAENEKFKIGGANLLRGFQEEQFSSGAFALGTIEWRYSFGSVSNIHFFIDGGWMDEGLFPYSPGIGLSLDTRAGLLGLDYSFGQIMGEGFSLQTGLIHLSIQSIF